MDIKFGKYLAFSRSTRIDTPEIVSLVNKVETLDGKTLKPMLFHRRVFEHILAVVDKGQRGSKLVGAAAIAEPNERYLDFWIPGVEPYVGDQPNIIQVGTAVMDVDFRGRDWGVAMLDRQIKTIQNYYEATAVSVVKEEDKSSQAVYEEFGAVAVARHVMTDRGPVNLFVFNEYRGELAS